MNAQANQAIEQMSDDLLNKTEANGAVDYDDYLNILSKLDERQIINIVQTFFTRFDPSVENLPREDRKKDAIDLVDRTPESLRYLLACPLVTFRHKEFIEFTETIENIKDKTPSEIFWQFAETFPTKTYYRVLRVTPGQDISFYTRMLTAPSLRKTFSDFGDSTNSPITGNFEEAFTYHIYRGYTQGSLISWSEEKNVAFFAVLDKSAEVDKDWDKRGSGRVVLVTLTANSFFFLDETEVNKSATYRKGVESLLFMSLPFEAITKGGMRVEVFSKEKSMEYAKGAGLIMS